MENSSSDFKGEKTKSRRFSASSLKSLREDERCLRSISSTASSPGYTSRGEIDPSTYSFTAALKALQAKAVYSWEYLPPHRLSLHSKWSDAEKYISNPLSGEVPVECLSAKTLSARSFSGLRTNRITISAPLVYSPHHFRTSYPIIEHQHKLNITIQEKKRCAASDVGVQKTPADVSSGAPSPAPATPSIEERARKFSEGGFGDSPLSGGEEKSEPKVEEREREEKECRKAKEGRERKKKRMKMCRGGGRRGCLVSLKGLWERYKCRPRKNNNSSSSPTFLCHINAFFGF